VTSAGVDEALRKPRRLRLGSNKNQRANLRVLSVRFNK
jgi:hypothetical protein